MAKVVLSALVTSISGSIGNLSFSRTSNGTIVFTKPYSSPKLNDARRKFLDFYRQALYVARTCSQADFDTFLMLLQLWPRYAKNVSKLESSARFHYAQLYFNCLLADLSPSLYLVYSPEPLAVNVLAVHLTGGALIVTLSREITEFFEIVLIFISERYSSPKPYLSSRTSFIGSVGEGFDSIDVTEAYISRFGVLPEIGEYVCVTSSCFNYESGHIANDQTDFYQVIA